MEGFVQVVGRQLPCTARAAPRDASSATPLHQKLPAMITSAAVAALLATSSLSLVALPAKADAPENEVAKAAVDIAKDADAAAQGLLDQAAEDVLSATENASPMSDVQGAVDNAAKKLSPGA
jgi:hypothetical protein